MLFLASFILKGQSQAALVAATMAILGLLAPPAAWISAAVIVLVTLVNGPRSGLVTTAFSLAGTAIFAYLLFSAPQVAVIFVLLAWLPAWIAASVLGQMVSLAMSLQVLTGIGLFAVTVIYAVFPDFGELWREPMDVMVQQLAAQSDDISLQELKHSEDLVITFLPGLFASSLLFGTMLSLLLGRWWQAVFFNPGGFAKEFQALNLGKVSAIFALALLILAMSMGNIVLFSLLAVVSVLYGMQALSLLHAFINIRKISRMWIFVIYVIMFFIPHTLILLILASFIDPWLNIRQRITTSA